MARTVPEWRGKTDDAAIPTRVKQRIIDRQRPGPNEAPICPDCGQPIIEGDGCEFDHEVALIDGGEHAEHNIWAKHRRCHRLKTAKEAQQRAVTRNKRAKSLGIKKSRHSLSHPRLKRRMDGTVVDRQTGEPV